LAVTPKRRVLLALPWLAVAAIGWYLVREPADSHAVRFALYRPAAAQFYLDRGAAPGGALDYAHDAKDTVPFGVPGDVGLACPQDVREEPRGFRAYTNGNWFLSGAATRPAKGDVVLGQPGDIPFCADFDGDGIADSGVFRGGEWFVATKRAGDGVDIRFSLGTAGDRPVVLNVRGAGNASDRRNVVYGVYRRGMWYLDTKGTGAVDAAHGFGGLPQDLPLLIPRWSGAADAAPAYSLAIFRDGTWHVKPDPDGAQTISFSFGAPGDLPGFVR
jgi:hypothetical protein